MRRAVFDRRSRVLVFVDLVQDIDVLLPLIVGMRDDPVLEPRVVVSRWLRRESPRTAALLAREKVPFDWVRRAQVASGHAPAIGDASALLSAAESDHPAHAAGHALARRAEAAGIPAFTVQHGLENVGLRGPEASRRFASSTVFCWFPSNAVPAETPAENRPKLRHVGRPAPLDRSGKPAMAYEVGVFENLHSERYGAPQRERVRAGVSALAEMGLNVLIRPHPAGGWSEALTDLGADHPNLRIQSVAAVRQDMAGVTAAVLCCRRVITTPSTVVMDAMQLKRPIVLAVPGGPAYDGIQVLTEPGEWGAFARAPLDQCVAPAAFLRTNLLPGDGAPRIVAQIGSDLRQKGLAEMPRM